MIKLSDYVIDFLAKKGVKDIFLCSGGGIMHLLDSVGQHPEMSYTCNYHEQAAAISAEAYARVTNHLGVCLVTTGPASMNALAGMAGSWINSTPIMVLSGQVRRQIIADYSKIRQYGPQEINTVDVVRPITKYAVTIMDPEKIRYEMEKAYYYATSGRPGPVWLDFPLDVQAAMIDEQNLVGFTPEFDDKVLSGQALVDAVKQVVDALRQSRRPLLLGGNGIQISRSVHLLKELMETYSLPLVAPYTAPDLMPESHPMNMGVFGTNGQRRANFTVQNADLVLSLGSGLCVTKTGFDYKNFATKAKKIFVDVDEGQLYHQNLVPDLGIQADVKDFMAELVRQLKGTGYRPSEKWLQVCANWKARYPVMVPEYYVDSGFVNSYVFMDVLSNLLAENDILVPGNGLDSVSFYQAFKFKTGQRYLINGNWGSMGWDLPLAVGACVARKGRVICVTGDGSLQWNVQELMTISHNRLPVFIFAFNNSGYASIRATQNNFFEGRKVGADQNSGVGNPDFKKLAEAYGITYARIEKNDDIEPVVQKLLKQSGPVFCEVSVALDQFIFPRASSFRREDGTLESRPLHDMAPFLPREEIWENMHLFDEDEPAKEAK